LEFDEPFSSMRHQGLILGPDGEKMSKSRKNVVNPDYFVNKYGADTIRMYLCFMGPYEQGGPWNPKAIVGVYRFLDRVRNLIANSKKRIANSGRNKELNKVFHRAIKKIGEDIESLRFNTAVSELMKLLNEIEHANSAPPSKDSGNPNAPIRIEYMRVFLKLLAPFAPHLAEEIWSQLGNRKSIHLEKWPKYDQRLIEEEMIDLVVQVNGRTRDIIKTQRGLTENEARELALASEKIKKYVSGKEIKKFIYLSDKLANFVVQ